MTPKLQGYLYLALAMALVGSTVVASKVIAAGLPPFTATALRLALALPCFALLMVRAGIRLPRPDRRDGLLLLVQATAGSVGYTTLLILGLTMTSAADGGVIVGTLPVVSAAIAMLLLGERPQPMVLAAIALAAAGVLAITLRGGDGGDRSLLGNALILGAVVCEGLFILLNKRLRRDIAPLAQSTLMTALGLAVALIPATFEQPWTLPFDAGVAWAIVYYALAPTVGGYLLWYAGAARVSGAEAALFTAVAPVAAVLLAFAVLGEPLSLNQVLGVGLVLVAVFSLARKVA
jgi:drug/metabolite transporter (DMT)-like permease